MFNLKKRASLSNEFIAERACSGGTYQGGVHLMDKITIAERLTVGALSSVYTDDVGGRRESRGGGGGSSHTHYRGPAFLRAVEVTPYGSNSPGAPNGSQVVVHLSTPTPGGGIEVRADDGFELNSACGEC